MSFKSARYALKEGVANGQNLVKCNQKDADNVILVSLVFALNKFSIVCVFGFVEVYLVS